MSEGKPLVVVEDEETDALLLKLGLEEAGIPNQLLMLQDGQQLIDYFSGLPPFNNRDQFPMPGLVLLDLKMPRVDGFEVLSWLSTRDDLSRIPTVVFSASTCEADIKKAFQLGARDYLSKPSQFRVLVEILQALHKRWLCPGIADEEQGSDLHSSESDFHTAAFTAARR